MTRPRSPATYATIGSLVLHGGVAAWLLTRPAPEAKREHVQPIEFAFYEPPPAALATAAPVPEREPSSEVGQPAQSVRTKPAPKAAASSVQVVPSVEPVTASPTAAQETASSPVQPAAKDSTPTPTRFVDISPLAAALTMRDTLGVVGSCASISGDAGCSEGVRKEAPALASGPRAGQRSVSELDLKHEADGSLSYNDPAFVARIAPDGRVHFEDKIQDLNTLVERHLVGAQINTSAKRRFIESTAALREQLATQSEARNQVTAAAALRAKLASVLASGTLSLAQKRSTLFELWDSCASDESGNAAQAAIESFIRARLPADSPLAYSSVELAQLNKRRASRRAFDPYGSADAGALPS